jgi:acyl-coenzyme A thioesterase PaaI-like protein
LKETIMNTLNLIDSKVETMKTIAISILALGSAAALASDRGDAVPLRPQSSLQSALTRADVTAGYIRARNEDTLIITGDAVPLQPQVSLQSVLTRADVTADYIRARNQGTLVIVGDAVPLQPQVSVQSGLTRAEVTADYIRARNEGTLVITGDAVPLNAQWVTQGTSRDRDAVKAEAAHAARA